MILSRELGAAVLAALFFSVSPQGHAQENSLLKNIELCNGSDRNSQIEGCTALITSNATTSLGLAIAYNNRGNAYTSIGKYDLAIADFDKALELNPAFMKALNNRGVVYEKKGDEDRALESFDAALELDKTYPYALVNRGDVYSKKQDYQRALADYDKAVQADAKLASAWSGRCLARAQTGNLKTALEDCNEAIRLATNAAGYDARGFTRLKMEQWDGAIADYDSALKLEPKFARSLYGRGYAKRKKGALAAAEADIKAAQELDPAIAESFKQAGLN
jgi:tetratricopeptide (TPR) repeat protein